LKKFFEKNFLNFFSARKIFFRLWANYVPQNTEIQVPKGFMKRLLKCASHSVASRILRRPNHKVMSRILLHPSHVAMNRSLLRPNHYESLKTLYFAVTSRRFIETH